MLLESKKYTYKHTQKGGKHEHTEHMNTPQNKKQWKAHIYSTFLLKWTMYFNTICFTYMESKMRE